jgi:hypothetical protein
MASPYTVRPSREFLICLMSSFSFSRALKVSSDKIGATNSPRIVATFSDRQARHGGPELWRL